MAQTYRPVLLSVHIVDRLQKFKERLGTQVFDRSSALGLGACIGVLMDIEAFVTQTQRVPLHAEVKAMAEKYPQRGRPRVSEPVRDLDRGHDLTSFGPGVRACTLCHIRFGNDEEIFAQCLGSPAGEPGDTVKP